MRRAAAVLVVAILFAAQCGTNSETARNDIDSFTPSGFDVAPIRDVAEPPADAAPPPDAAGGADGSAPRDVVARPDGTDAGQSGGPDAGPPDGGAPACHGDEECTGLALDLCTVARCEAGRCVTAPKPCEDGDGCTFDVCNPASGLCEHTPNPECGCLGDADCPDDTNDCTLPACRIPDGAAFGVCGFRASTVGCDDHDPCTEGAVCTAAPTPLVAVCAGGAPVDCDDGDQETLDWCAPEATPACRHVLPAALPPCPGGQDDCPTPDGCMAFVCDGAAADPRCRPQPRSGSCDDGNFCTVGDTCADEVCVGGAPRDCDDGDPRTLDSCDPEASACDHRDTGDAIPCATPLDCIAALGPPDGPCRQWLCPQGVCRDVGVPEDTSCDDGLFCTVDDRCRQGACVGGPPRDCDDGVPLTDCACDEAEDRCACGEDFRCGTGCVTGSDCDDGDPCTTDACATYLTPTVCTCRPRPACRCDPAALDGGAAACDDGQADTQDTCVPNDDPAVPYPGLCEHVLRIVCAQPCAGVGDGAACDDGEKCTLDACEPSLDPDHPYCCVHPTLGPPCGRDCKEDAECSDGLACTPDRCGADETCEPPGPPREDCCASDDDCPEDDDPCTARRCDPITGACGFATVAAACDDGDVCTVNDACDAGVCRGSPRDCADGDDCTDDRCDPVAGCVHTLRADPPPACVDCRLNPAVCDDGDVCTDDTCDPGGRCHNVERDEGEDTPLCRRLACRDEVDCDDGNPCTVDRCVPAPPDPDGDGPIVPVGACAYAEDATCSIQVPGSGHPLACADAVDCDPADCLFDDPAAFCHNPSDDCPTPVCDAQTGCRFLPTVACPLGECTPATAWRDCFDWNPCTVDECDPATFTCVPPEERRSALPEGGLLTGCRQCETEADCAEDVQSLEVAPACLSVACVRPPQDPTDDPLGVCHAWVDQALFPAACEDYDLCTVDACVPGGGCTHTPVAEDCRLCFLDGDCEDQNPCTVDRCESGVTDGGRWGTGFQCSHTALEGCKPCSTHSDCDLSTTSTCAGEICKMGICRSIDFPGDLALGGICYPDANCVTPEDCGEVPGGDPICTSDFGECIFQQTRVTCRTWLDCETTDVCERPSACVDGLCQYEPIPDCDPRQCSNRADCDDGRYCTSDWCNGGRCLWIGNECCDAHTDCGGLLEPRMNDCGVRACAPDDVCRYIPIDESVRCGDVCETDADCQRTCEERVDPDTGAVLGQACQSFCLKWGRCSDAAPCPFGTCERAPGAATGSCIACYDWPCSQGACSANGRCVWFDGDCSTCQADSDCLDPDPCTTDTCVAGACQHAPDPACVPIPCDADGLCDNGDRCAIGVCLTRGCVFLPNPFCESP